MNQKLKSAVFAVPVTAAVLLAGGAVRAAPAVANMSATVQVLEQIVISEDFNLDFGDIDKPSTGFSVFTIDPFTGAITESGPGNGVAIGNSHQRGQYDITGTDQTVLVMTANSLTCSAGGLQFGGIQTDLPPGAVLDISDMMVGGVLTVTPTAPTGAHTCSYSITASYN